MKKKISDIDCKGPLRVVYFEHQFQIQCVAIFDIFLQNKSILLFKKAKKERNFEPQKKVCIKRTLRHR